MRAINLPHFKLKLRDVSRELYIEHGWHMPSGLVNSAEADPRNFTRAEWQQAKRAEWDPRALKETFQDCWAISDSRKAFAQALAAWPASRAWRPTWLCRCRHQRRGLRCRQVDGIEDEGRRGAAGRSGRAAQCR